MPRIFVRYLYMVSLAALFAGGAWAADYTRLPGNGKWQDSTLWNPNGVPGASDTARFESTSGSVTLSAATSVGLLDLAGTYTGTLDLNGQTLTASQVSMAGGVLNGGSGSLTVTGSMALAGGTLNAPSVLTLRGNVDFSGGSFVHNGGTTCFSVNYNATQSTGTGSAVFNHVVVKGYAASTTTINGDLSVAGDLSFGMSGYSGCLLNGGRILAQKNVRMDSNAFGTGGSGPGSATIVFCGAGDQTLDGAQPGRFPNVKIEKPSGVFRLAGAPQVFGSWTWAGADGLDSGASALTIATPYNATVAVNGGPYSYGGVVTFKGWGQFSKHDLIGDFLVQNLDLSMVAYSGNQITGASFVVSGDVRILDAGFGSASWGPGNSTIKLVGGGNHLIASYAAGHFPNMLIDTAGSVTTVGDVIVSGNWTLVNGAFTQGAGTTLDFQAPYGGTQTIAPGAAAYGNVKISGDGLSNQNVAGTLNCQNFTLTTRAYTGAKLNDGTVEVHGDFALPGDGFGASDGGPGSAVVKLAGSGTVTAGGLARCPSLVVDTSGTVTFVGNMRLGSHYAHASGTVVAAGSTQTFVGRQDSLVMGAARFGNLIVQKGPYGAPYKVTLDGQAAASGGFTLTEGTFVFAENASLAVGGDVSVAAANVSVTAGNNSTLELNGAAAQSVNLANHAVFNLSVANAAAPVTFTGAYTASGTTSAAPGAGLTFASGVTFNTGKLTMNGTPAQGIALRASTEGSAASVVAAPYQFVRYADIKDINASGGPKIVALHGTDGGNNQNIVFQDAALLALSTQAASKTSPAWVEGVSGPDATSVNVTVDGNSFAAARLNPAQWYAQNAPAASSLGVVLSPDAASSLDVTTANAFGESNTAHQDLTWTATDFAGKSYSTDMVKIRKGDSLLLTATGAGTTLEIDADGDGTYEHSGAPGQKFPHLYAAPGSFVARAKIDGVEAGSLTVIVVSTNLHGPVACQKDYERALQVYALPAAEAPNVAYAAADPYALGLTVTQVTGDGAQLKLKPASMDSPYFVSRLGDASGPVLDLQPLAVFTVKDLNSHILGFAVDSSGYGRAIIRYQITPRTVIDNDNPVTTAQEGLYFDLGCLGTDMVFAENGLSSLRVHSNRQDADGIFEVEALLSPTGTFVCHSIQPRQINSDNLVGNYLYHNPCVMKAAGGLYLHREMSDETTRDGKTNLYPEGHPEAGKQIFQVWDQDPQIDGRWTSEIEVSAFTPQAMEAAFFAEKARKKVMPNRHFTVKVEQPGNSYQFAVRMQPGTTGIKGGADIEDNNGVNRDEVLYEREPSLPENYLKWEGGFPSAYPALNLPPNHWGIDYQDPARKYKSWDSPFQRYYPHPWYTDIGFFKGNMIGKMTVWGTCTPVTSEVPRDHVLPNVRPGAPANPHTNSTFSSNDLLWGGEETEFRDILKFGRLEADGYLETDIPDNGSGQGSTTADISSRNAFPDVVGANVFEVQKEIQVPDPNNQNQTLTYLRTQHEGNVGTASPVPVQISFRAPPGETVRVGVAISRRSEREVADNPLDNDGKKTHRAWLHQNNTAIFEYRGQPGDSDDVKAGKVVEILAFNQDGTIAQEKPAERVVNFSLTADSNWIASKVLYIYGIEPSKTLDDLKLVVWGEEVMDWKAYPKEVQTHHYENEQLDPDLPVRRWYITDEEPLNVIKLEFVIPDASGGGPMVTDLTANSDPHPTISLDEVSPSEVVVTGATASLKLSGYVKDSIADNAHANGSSDIASVQVLVNSDPIGSPAQVMRVADGNPSFWRQHPYKGVFDPINLEFPLTSPGPYQVKVQSSPNTLGYRADENMIVRTSQRDLPGGSAGGGASVSANIYFPANPTPTTLDTIQFYYGNRDPQPLDTVLSENTSTLYSRNAFRILLANSFQPDAVDTMVIQLRTNKSIEFNQTLDPEIPDTITLHIGGVSVVLTESGANTLDFKGVDTGLGACEVVLTSLSGLSENVVDSARGTISIENENGGDALGYFLEETGNSTDIFEGLREVSLSEPSGNPSSQIFTAVTPDFSKIGVQVLNFGGLTQGEKDTFTAIVTLPTIWVGSAEFPMEETGNDSKLFVKSDSNAGESTLIFYGTIATTPIRVAVKDFAGLTPEIDTFNGEVSFLFGQGSVSNLKATFTETGPQTNIFRVTFSVLGGTEGSAQQIWSIDQVEISSGSNPGTYLPMTIRVAGVREVFRDKIHIEIGGTQVPVAFDINGIAYIKGPSKAVGFVTVDRDPFTFVPSDPPTYTATFWIYDEATGIDTVIRFPVTGIGNIPNGKRLLAKVKYSQAGGQITAAQNTLEIFPPVVFSKSASHSWGFDDTDPNPDKHWISVGIKPASETQAIGPSKINVKEPDGFEITYDASPAFSVSEKGSNIGGGLKELELTGKKDGWGYIKPQIKIHGVAHDFSNTMNVWVRTLKQIRVALVEIRLPGEGEGSIVTAADLATVKTNINDVWKQAVIQVKGDIAFQSELYNWDTNNNGTVNTGERIEIYRKLELLPNFQSFNSVMGITSKGSTEVVTRGETRSKSSRLTWIGKSFLGATTPSHELGHNLGLGHPKNSLVGANDDEFNVNMPNANLLSSDQTILEEPQWDKVNPIKH